MAQNWFHAAQGRSEGPFLTAQMLALIAEGAIRPQTLVWRSGLANWEPASAHFDFAPPPDTRTADPTPKAPRPRQAGPELADPDHASPGDPRYLDAAPSASSDWIARARATAPQPMAGPQRSPVRADTLARIEDREPMLPTTAILRVYRRGITFSGRSSRPEFWWFALFHSLLMGLAMALDQMLLKRAWVSFPVLTLIVALANLLPNYAVATRRLHDSGKSGIWIVLQILVPVGLTAVAFLVMLGLIGVDGLSPEQPEKTLLALWNGLMIYIASGFVALGLSIYLLILFARPGDSLENRYGPPPP